MANIILKPEDIGTALDNIRKDNYPMDIFTDRLYPVGFIETENKIIDIKPEIDKKYPGLLIDTVVVKDAASKARATRSLRDWKCVVLTAREWIEHLCAGHIIQPSSFTPTPDGTYTHAKEYWQWTHFVFADADHIRGVEFLSNGADKNPEGVEPFTDHAGLKQFPTLPFKVYAITESVSSMHKKIPHRRYRLIFLFDEPIRSEAHYHQILLSLAAAFAIIPPVTRSPAQPILGNARVGHNHAAILGNTLRTQDYPYHEPEPTQERKADEERATDDDLYHLLTENHINFEIRPRGGFYVRCPNTEQHTGGICNRTDAYVFIGDTGAKAFHCSHQSCQQTRKSSWAAFKEGYNLKGQHRDYTAKVRLHVKSDAAHVKTDVMDTIRTLLQAHVLDWLLKVYDADKKQLLIVNTGTATGKSHVVMTHIDNLLMLTPTIELAEETYHKAMVDFEKNAALHKSSWHNWSKYREYLENRSLNRANLKMSLTDPDGVTCREPEIKDAIYRKGHSARKKYCEILCPWRNECWKQGNLSQYRVYQDKIQDALQVYTAQPQEAITDAETKEILHAYGLDRDGTVLVVDEADPIKMIPLRQINYDDWRDAAAFYNLTSAGVFFDILLRETATVPNRAPAENAEEHIAVINDNGLAFRNAIQRAFDTFKQYLKQYNQTLKQGLKQVQATFDEVASWELDKTDIDPKLAQLYDGHPAKIDAQIQNLQYNHQDLIPNLQTLLESSKDSQTPPVRNLGEGRWEFAVPPTLNAKKNIFLTANNTTELIRTQFQEVDAEIQTTENLQAPWMPGNKLYQINTGRYTPRSLFKMKMKTMYKPNGEKIRVDEKATLTPRGKEIIELILATLKDSTDTLIVAPGAFCEQELWTDDSPIRQLHALPNAHIATHQHAIGVNRYSELPREFLFHYEPHLLELVFATKAMHPNETLSFERERITLQKHGVILYDVWRFKDERVQLVYDAMCENPMMQSENRIRPQLYKNKEIWRLTAEPIAAPTTPILFSIPDWQAWIQTEQTQNFDAFLQARANRNVEDVAAEDSVSTREAYRRTENTRKVNKAIRDAEIIRLHNEGHKQSDIAMHISEHFGKINQGTVSRVINQYTKE